MIIIIIVRVFFILDSNVLTKLIPTINAAAKITAFTACLPRLTSIYLAQPGLTRWGTASAAGCCHVITGTHSPLKKPSFYLASLSPSRAVAAIEKLVCQLYQPKTPSSSVKELLRWLPIYPKEGKNWNRLSESSSSLEFSSSQTAMFSQSSSPPLMRLQRSPYSLPDFRDWDQSL